MDDIGNPVENAWSASQEIHEFPQNFVNFDRNSMKTIQSIAKFWNSPKFRISKVWNPVRTATVILGNPERFKYPIRCRP